MANPEHVAKLKKGVKAWNAWREENPEVRPDLSGADLRGADLRGADLRGADLRGAVLNDANLGGADLRGAVLSDADLSGAILSGANLSGATLPSADLRIAGLRSTNLSDTILSDANLSDANLGDANLGGANLSGAIVCRADLSGANLGFANLYRADLSESKLGHAKLWSTIFAECNLSSTTGLDSVAHWAPSTIGLDTLQRSGSLPEVFLRGCGYSKWHVEMAKLHDSNLSAHEISEITNSIFLARVEGPLYLGGFFISYSRDDGELAEKLRVSLIEADASVWMDVHDAVGGPLERQIVDAVRLNDIVLLVLSERSVNSEWVEGELRTANRKAKEEKRDVILPIALDKSWEPKVEAEPVLWRQVQRCNVLDFSEWQDSAKFSEQFEKVLAGAKRYYAPKAKETAP